MRGAMEVEPETTDRPAQQAMLKSALKEVMTVRKLALLGAAAALWLFVAALPVFADGGPHMKATNNGTAGLSADSCAGCHRAHTATAADLLNSEQPELCLNCHDGSKATTDVVDGVQYTSWDGTKPNGSAVLGALRGGGFSYALIDSGNAARVSYLSSGAIRNIGHVQPLATGQKVTSTHSMSGSGTVWGNGAPSSPTKTYGATVTMECSSCHNPHGNGLYRVLQTLPGEDFAATSPGFDQTNNAGVEVQDTTYTTLRNYTIRPSTGGTVASLVAGTSGDYWRYHWDPTGVKSWALTSGGPGADPMNTGWNSLTATYVTSGPTNKYVVAYPVNAAGIAAYNTQLAAYGINDPVTSTASISVLDNRGGLMTAWCIQCHSRYNGNQSVQGTSPAQSLGASSLFDNSGGDAVFMFKHGTTRIGCEQCHVSHGSNALMTGSNSLDYTNPDGSIPTHVTGAGSGAVVSGDSRLLKVDNRGTCQLCHDPTGTVTAGTYIGPVSTPGN